jgi:hypothetical protein
MKVSIEASMEYILHEIGKHIVSKEDEVKFELKTDP